MLICDKCHEAAVRLDAGICPDCSAEIDEDSDDDTLPEWPWPRGRSTADEDRSYDNANRSRDCQ